jgi:hypothetical protein
MPRERVGNLNSLSVAGCGVTCEAWSSLSPLLWRRRRLYTRPRKGSLFVSPEAASHHRRQTTGVPWSCCSWCCRVSILQPFFALASAHVLLKAKARCRRQTARSRSARRRARILFATRERPSRAAANYRPVSGKRLATFHDRPWQPVRFVQEFPMELCALHPSD